MLLHGTEVTKSYIIASLQRTGSYLLCEALEGTGIAGMPTEPFTILNKDIFSRMWDIDVDMPFPEYIKEVVKNCTTPNGVFGVKIHWAQIEYVRKQMGIGEPKDEKILDILFPGSQYIHLTRRDVRGQAISSHRAYTTNEWWRKENVYNPQIVAPDPPFSSRDIRLWEIRFRERAADWVRYFEERNMTPLHVEYDDLCIDWRHELYRSLIFLGYDENTAKHASITALEPQLVQQADARTRAWRKRLDDEDAAQSGDGKKG